MASFNHMKIVFTPLVLLTSLAADVIAHLELAAMQQISTMLSKPHLVWNPL